ncbi:MAG TPA: 3-oxoacyl-[acyl-carrier-protein] reductase [Candidatus Avacidaminococcus intestinavium]|uniref:3-oxoacyl-[acyl-carrier-protein] reductase n=1 Tax=Candidatus Avacidaminococcus intestinavium TaxID=2840684 RepID=A0A9D1MNV3_9FIRM|nr:3-oxoacyl-[acyl-carrier-protein] reductase [Candidatus Avacidaminococcus intestinavium]
MQIEGKVAFVTGASRGIGRAIAIALAKAGADVVLNYAGNTEAAEKVATEIRNVGRKALLLQGDVADATIAGAMIESIINEFGRLDILVNNAGITRDGLLMRMKEEDWDAVLNTNLKGVFNCTKAAVKYMMKQKSGKIVNISSVVGLTGNAGQANYAAAKAGCIGFTKSIAKEVASRGINVNAVAPGLIATDMTQVLPEKVIAEMTAGIPLKREGLPQDVANAVLFLVSEHADYITGQTINVDGGMVM